MRRVIIIYKTRLFAYAKQKCKLALHSPMLISQFGFRWLENVGESLVSIVSISEVTDKLLTSLFVSVVLSVFVCGLVRRPENIFTRMSHKSCYNNVSCHFRR